MRLPYAMLLVAVLFGWIYLGLSASGSTPSGTTTQSVNQYGFSVRNTFSGGPFSSVRSDTSFRLVDTLDLPQGNQVGPGQLSKDGLQYYVELAHYLYVLERQTVGSSFGAPRLLQGVINSSSVINTEPTITADGRTVVFVRNSNGLWTGNNLYLATRPDTSSPFNFVRALSEINHPDSGEGYPWISPDGLVLYFSKLFTLAFARRNSIAEPFGSPQQLRINSPWPFAPWLSDDQLKIYFSQQAPVQCVYSATRPSPFDTFQTPSQLSEFAGFWFTAGPSMIADEFYILHISPQQSSSMILVFRHDTTTVSAQEHVWNGPTQVLMSTYPNPFNPTTTIDFTIPQDSHIVLEVYNIKGERVSTLVEGKRTLGHHSVTWDASRFASGLYFCRLQTTSQTTTRKLVLLK